MPQTFTELMTSLSRELGSLAKQTSDLQDQLSPRSLADFDVEAFQSLDTLTQTLESLAGFVHDVGARASCSCGVGIEGALGSIRLSALAERLEGRERAQTQPLVTEVELF